MAVLSSVPAVLAGLERLLEGEADLAVIPVRGRSPLEADALVVAEEPLWREVLLEWAGAAEAWPAPILLSDDEGAGRFLVSLASGRGGWGALPVAVSGEELRRAVRAVAAGLVVIHPFLLSAILPVGSGETGEPRAELTDREQEVLDLLSKGFSNPEIANLLGISDHTVKFHASSLYAKLGVANRTEAVRAGIRSGSIHL